MRSFKDQLGKYIVSYQSESENIGFGFYSIGNNSSYGIFKILPYNIECFPDVDYKIVIDPVDKKKFRKRACYIMDFRFMDSPCVPYRDYLCDTLEEAEELVKKLNAA